MGQVHLLDVMDNSIVTILKKLTAVNLRRENSSLIHRYQSLKTRSFKSIKSSSMISSSLILILIGSKIGETF